MEDLRERLSVETALVIVGGADDGLRLSKKKKKSENVTQCMVRAFKLYPSSAKAVTGRRCPQSGVGEDFLARRTGSPHKNGRNSETKSRKIDPKVPKQP